MMSPLAAIRRWPGGRFAAAAVLPGGADVFEGDVDADFPLASLTKPLVAVAALVAVEDGSIELDQPAGPPGASVRHLLAHASGLDASSDRVLAPPGTRRIYSNRGYDLLGAELEAATGISLGPYVTEAVLHPLGMRATTAGAMASTGAAGTVRDVARFVAELMATDPVLLAASTRDLATRVAFPGLPGVLPGFGRQEANDWGLGFEVRGSKEPHWTPPAASPATFGHFGRSGSLMWIDPTVPAALVVLGDRPFGEWAPPLWRELGAAVLQGANT